MEVSVGGCVDVGGIGEGVRVLAGGAVSVAVGVGVRVGGGIGVEEGAGVDSGAWPAMAVGLGTSLFSAATGGVGAGVEGGGGSEVGAGVAVGATVGRLVGRAGMRNSSAASVGTRRIRSRPRRWSRRAFNRAWRSGSSDAAA